MIQSQLRVSFHVSFWSAADNVSGQHVDRAKFVWLQIPAIYSNPGFGKDLGPFPFLSNKLPAGVSSSKLDVGSRIKGGAHAFRIICCA